MNNQKRQIIENYVNAYNNFDIDGMKKQLSQDIVFENIANGKVDLRTEGIEAFIKQAELSKRYFKQRKQSIETWDFNTDKVSIVISYIAILALDLPNGLKAGDTIELIGKTDFELENGKIKSITDES